MNPTEYLLTTSQSSEQFSACLWDYKTLNVQKYYRNGGTVPPKCLEILGQDYMLAAELGKPLLRVWSLNNQDIARNVRLVLPEPAACLAVCPKNVYLAIGMTCKVYVWHLSSGKLLSVQQKNYQPVNCIKFSSDGDYLLVGGQDGMLVVYNFGDLVTVSSNFLIQSEIGQVEPVYVKNDHSLPIRDIHIGHFGRQSRFATVSSDQTCRIYSLLHGDNLLNIVFNELLTSVIFDAPCWNLFVGTESGIIRQYALNNPPRSLTHHIDNSEANIFKGHSKKVICLALNNTGTILASGSEDHYVFTWDIQSRQILKKIQHKGPVTNIKFLPSYGNIFAEQFKPKIIVKSLQRSIDLNSSLIVSQMQEEDIQLSDDENSAEKELTREYLAQENIKLRIINKQLYNAALDLSSKIVDK